MSTNTDQVGPGITDRSIKAGTLKSRSQSDALKDGTYAFAKMNRQPVLTVAAGYGDPTGVTGDVNHASFTGKLLTAYHVKGAGQTLLGPLMDVDKGLDISQDQTDNDGVEHVFGAYLGASNPFRYVCGTSKPKFVRLKFRIADVSGTDDCALGWRKVEAFQANIDDYDEAAWLNIILGALKKETILNNGATSTTSLSPTWADDATHEMEVRMIGSKAYFFFDGSEVGSPFTFDDAEVLVPFFFFLQATTSPGKVWWTELEIGDLEQVGKDRERK